MSAYYNENDPRAAAWLRKLIKQGHIAHCPLERAVTQATDILTVAALLGSVDRPDRLLRAINDALEILRPFRNVEQ